MNFINSQYLLYIILIFFIFIFIFLKLNHSYFKWVKTYWHYEQSNWNKISNFIYGLAIFLLLVSLLDLRGPETKVKTSLPDQRTIIILDSSQSMLCEDVRPSRFIKSIQIARHFVKSAAGHQIAIVLFSDLQKRLIPFTDDIDLLDSRLAALEKANAVSGGTNISQAITEASSYFESDSVSEEKGSGGNILVFTDAEEGDSDFKIDLPNSINLALVGIGTVKGGNIPLRWEDGSFRGYKMSKNEMITTKLDENYIKSIGKNVKNFRYWIANSYSLPTEEIMDFFRATYNQKHNNGDMRVRPVYSHYILIPAIILYCIAVFFGRFNSFRSIKTILLLFLISGISFAEDKPELSPELKKELTQIKEGKASRSEILKTAEKLLKSKDDQKATELYNEYTKKNDNEEVQFNHATALLKSGKTIEALPIIQDLFKNSKNEELKNKLRNNLSVASKQQQEKKKEEKNNKKEENKENDKKDGKKENQKDNKDNKDSKNQDKKGQEKDGASGKQGENKKDSGQDKKEEKKKEENKKNENKDKKDGEGKKPEEQKPQTLEQKEKEIEQKRRMTKTPGMIKQIMNDDRDLQKKMMDTSTKDKADLKPKRDW